MTRIRIHPGRLKMEGHLDELTSTFSDCIYSISRQTGKSDILYVAFIFVRMN